MTTLSYYLIIFLSDPLCLGWWHHLWIAPELHSMWYVVCCLLQCPSVQYTQCSYSQASDCLPLYPLLPPTLPPPATHPMAGCQDPPAATNHRAGCLPPYPLLPPILPPPARHPMTCVRTPPPATIPSLDKTPSPKHKNYTHASICYFLLNVMNNDWWILVLVLLLLCSRASLHSSVPEYSIWEKCPLCLC